MFMLHVGFGVLATWTNVTGSCWKN